MLIVFGIFALFLMSLGAWRIAMRSGCSTEIQGVFVRYDRISAPKGGVRYVPVFRYRIRAGECEWRALDSFAERARPDFVAALDCFVCNEIEAGRMFGLDLTKTPPEEMLALLKERIAAVGCRAMVITMGEQGAVYYERDTGIGGIAPAIPTKTVDSTGAGDAFLSGVVMGLSRGMPLSRAVDAGTALASATIQTDESCAAPDAHFWEQFQS